MMLEGVGTQRGWEKVTLFWQQSGNGVDHGFRKLLCTNQRKYYRARRLGMLIEQLCLFVQFLSICKARHSSCSQSGFGLHSFLLTLTPETCGIPINPRQNSEHCTHRFETLI